MSVNDIVTYGCEAAFLRLLCYQTTEMSDFYKENALRSFKFCLTPIMVFMDVIVFDHV